MTLDTSTRPLADLDSHEGAVTSPARDRVVGPRILLVDDNAELAAALSAALSEEGVRASYAESASGAAELFRTERFDAVVIDLVMPGTHGMALLADLRESPEGKCLPAVLLSELPKGETRDQARRLVAKLKRAAFLDKPASPRSLLVTLGQVMSVR
jgi:DNA-binding response OmpR family regulator